MRVLAMCLTALLLPVGILAQPEVTVGKIDPVKLNWGPQTIYAEVNNLTEVPKFISAIVRIQFEGHYLNPYRGFRTNFVLEPSVTKAMPIQLDIPPNYGVANVTIELYDVVDTVDQVLAEQKLTEERSRLLFKIPDQLTKYMQERIVLPPFMDNAPLFDSEFHRLALYLMRERKKVAEIAAMAEIDSMYLHSLNKKWQYYYFAAIARSDTTLRPAFPFITTEEAEELRPLADQTASALATVITDNFIDYRRVLDSLVKAGTLTTDSNAVLHPGTVLYQDYPVVGGLLLWYWIGRGFIAGNKSFNIFSQTDPCNAHMLPFMYAVVGGDVFNGRQYFSFVTEPRLITVMWSDSIPKVHCPQIYPFADRIGYREWYFQVEDAPEFFMFDTTLVHPALRALGDGTVPIVQRAHDSLRVTAERYEPASFVPGVAYWFWNWVATRTVDKLVAENAIKRRGNGHFRIESQVEQK